MQGHRRRRATQRSPATPISPKGGGGTRSISLSLLLHDVTDIASSSLRELDAVALATNVTIFMERGTYPRARPGDVNSNSLSSVQARRLKPAALMEPETWEEP